jgi:hypothetical protein
VSGEHGRKALFYLTVFCSTSDFLPSESTVALADADAQALDDTPLFIRQHTPPPPRPAGVCSWRSMWLQQLHVLRV